MRAVDRVFELLVGEERDDRRTGHNGAAIFAEVEARYGEGLLRLPTACLRFAIIVRGGIFPGCDERVAFRPAEPEIERHKINSARVQVPRTTFADEFYAVTGIGDHIALIHGGQIELIARARRFGKHHEYKIVSPPKHVALAKFVILKKYERLSTREVDRFQFECARKLKRNHALAGADALQPHGGFSVKREIVADRRVNRVAQRYKRIDLLRIVRWICIARAERRPHVVRGDPIGGARLSDRNLLLAALVHEKIERTQAIALDQCVEIRYRIARKPVRHGAERLRRGEAGHQLVPPVDEIPVGRGEITVRFDLMGQFGGRGVGEAQIRLGERLIDDRHADVLRKRSPFACIARQCDHVAVPGKDCPADPAVKRL